MAWSLLPVYSRNSTANFSEKTSAKSVYSLETSIEASSAFRWAIWALLEGCNSSSKSTLRAATWITKASYSESRAATANSYLPISSTCLIVGSTSPVVYDLYCKFWAWKLISTLLIVRKGIPSIKSGLTSANWKLSSKNHSLPSLSDTEKMDTIIP